MRLYDNTRISSFRTCPRKYFYRHYLHWEPVQNKVALAFGSAWHAAQEVIWPAIIQGHPKQQIMLAAMEAWTQNWVDEGQPHPQDMDYNMQQEYNPRTPMVAMEMIAAYVDERYSAIHQMELISVEKPFVVPLDPEDDNLFYIGKIDKVVANRSKILGIEHKTTTAYKKEGYFKASFLDSFSPNSQVEGYLYALHMTFPGQVGGIWVDGALVHKTETGFKFIPIEKRKEQLDLWLWETRHWIDQIEAHTEHVQTLNPTDKYMAAFPKQTGSCFDFNSACEYVMICKGFANPLSITTVPNGFRVHKWDPLEYVDAGPLLPTGEVQ